MESCLWQVETDQKSQYAFDISPYLVWEKTTHLTASWDARCSSQVGEVPDCTPRCRLLQQPAVDDDSSKRVAATLCCPMGPSAAPPTHHATQPPTQPPTHPLCSIPMCHLDPHQESLHYLEQHLKDHAALNTQMVQVGAAGEAPGDMLQLYMPM